MTKKNKTILIIAIVICVAVVTVLAVRHYSTPNFAKMTPQQFRQYMDSNEFRDANEDKKREIFDQMRDAREAQMEKQVNEYSALRDYEKTAYLDKIIDEMEARRAEFMAREANDANGPPDFNGPPDPNRFGRFGPQDSNSPRRMGQQGRQFRMPEPSRMRQRSARTSADTKAKMMQFRQDMMNRMQARGISGPGGGGGRGGGGMGGGPGGGGPGGP